jgi:ATP-binding cassette, subfamily B, bacterial
MKRFPFYQQPDAMDCGPTCLRMIARYYGKTYSLQTLRQKSFITREGVSLLGLSDAAEAIGFRTLMAKIPFGKLKEKALLPFIAQWRQRHFVVVYELKNEEVYVADPGHGLIRYSRQAFLEGWLTGQSGGAEAGIVLLLETTPAFYASRGEPAEPVPGFPSALAYLKPYRRCVIQLLVGMLAGSLLQLLFPLLTQCTHQTGPATGRLLSTGKKPAGTRCINSQQSFVNK